MLINLKNVLAASLQLAAAAAVPQLSAGESNHTFNSWAARHGKVYETASERLHRLEIWLENAHDVRAHQNAGHSWTMELNEFADLSEEEFAARNGLLPTQALPVANNGTQLLGAAQLPDSIDWRDHNLVNPVQNQGSCGSCWAFSTIVSIEGAHAKASGDLVKLSEQNLVDCVKGQTDPSNGQSCCNGCRGGLMNDAMQYVIDKQGGSVDTEQSYKYQGVGGSCSFTADAVGATIASFTQVTAGDEAALMQAVATVGPISVGVDASKGWQLYRGGVMHPPKTLPGFHPFKKKGCSSSPNKMDHGVAVVGYGTDDVGGDYWIVRNSCARQLTALCIRICLPLFGLTQILKWVRLRVSVSLSLCLSVPLSLCPSVALSLPLCLCLCCVTGGPNWGENGYIRLARGTNACGVSNAAVYPISA